MSITTRKLASYEGELHDAARRRTGFDDFGDPAYREGLRALLTAFDTDRQLTESGRMVTYDRILRALTARLYAQKGWAEHPEVLTIPICRPLIITGLPRTGTTALHKLLAVDPQFQGLESWLLNAPMIRPPPETWDTYPAYRAGVAEIEALYTRMPELRKVHNTVAGEVEECTAVLEQSFVSAAWSASGLPSYARWLLPHGARKSYLHYADVLRLIGARDAHKRWLLKSPIHIAEIDTLLEVFPDACIIQTHRDPLKAIPSLCSLVHAGRRHIEGENVHATVIGPEQCIYWRRALACMQTACQRLPDQFFHVDHRSFLAEPLGTIHAIYEHFGLGLSSETEQHMHAWVAAAPTSRHGEHKYAIDSWGVTPEEICTIFADYRAQLRFN